VGSCFEHYAHLRMAAASLTLNCGHAKHLFNSCSAAAVPLPGWARAQCPGAGRAPERRATRLLAPGAAGRGAMQAAALLSRAARSLSASPAALPSAPR